MAGYNPDTFLRDSMAVKRVGEYIQSVIIQAYDKGNWQLVEDLGGNYMLLAKQLPFSE